MKLGIVTNLFPPWVRGGAEQVAHRTAAELHRRGHELFVFTAVPWCGLGSLRMRVSAEGLGRVYGAFPPNLYHPCSPAKYPLAIRAVWHLVDLWSPVPARWMRRLIERERPDAVLTHNLKGLGIGVARALRARRVRGVGGPLHVHTVHDVQLSVPSGVLLHGREESGLNGSVARTWYEARMRAAFGSPEVVISPSRFLASFHRERGFFPDSLVRILRNPVPDPASGIERPVSRPSGPASFLFAGQVEEHKGVRILLDAFARLGPGIDAELRIAGDGQLARDVAAAAAGDRRIRALGRLSQEELAGQIARCDAVVVPSLCYENSPSILGESLGIGTPVIGSAIGGIPETITEGENGLLVVPGSCDALASAMTRFLAVASDFWRFGPTIRRGVEEHRLSAYVDRLEALLAGSDADRRAEGQGRVG